MSNQNSGAAASSSSGAAASSSSGAAAAASSSDDDDQKLRLSDTEILDAVKDLLSAKTAYYKTQKEFEGKFGTDKLLDEYGHFGDHATAKKHYLSVSWPTTTIFAISACVVRFSTARQICQQFAHFQFLLVGRAKFWRTQTTAQLCSK